MEIDEEVQAFLPAAPSNLQSSWSINFPELDSDGGKSLYLLSGRQHPVRWREALLGLGKSHTASLSDQGVGDLCTPGRGLFSVFPADGAVAREGGRGWGLTSDSRWWMSGTKRPSMARGERYSKRGFRKAKMPGQHCH